MIHEILFSNEELNDLPIEARYLYIATIVHADDAGRMRADPKYLKLKAFPFDNHMVDEVLTWRNQLSTKTKLIVVYEVDGKEYLFHPNWNKWQLLRKDRMKPTDCPNPCQPSVNQVSTTGQPSAAEVRKLRKLRKLTEGKEVKELTTTDLLTQESKATSNTFPEATWEDQKDPYDRMKLEGKVYGGR